MLVSIIHPHPEKVGKRFPDHEDDIIVIENYFGRNGEQEVINNIIKEELKKIYFPCAVSKIIIC
jgi:hypothetical protein